MAREASSDRLRCSFAGPVGDHARRPRYALLTGSRCADHGALRLPRTTTPTSGATPRSPPDRLDVAGHPDAAAVIIGLGRTTARRVGARPMTPARSRSASRSPRRPRSLVPTPRRCRRAGGRRRPTRRDETSPGLARSRPGGHAGRAWSSAGGATRRRYGMHSTSRVGARTSRSSTTGPVSTRSSEASLT